MNNENTEHPLILVHYININGMTQENADNMLNDISQNISLYSKQYDNLMNFIVPIREGENRVECINPQFISEDEFEDIQEVAQEFKDLLEEKINGDIFQ